MKRYLLFTFILTVFGCSTLFAQSGTKIGYIDSQVILAQYPAAIKAQGEVQAAIDKVKSSIDSLGQAYQQAMADYQKQANMMTDAKKKEVQQKIVNMEKEYNDLRGKLDTNGEVSALSRKLMGPIVDQVKTTVEEVAKKEGIKLVLEKNDQLQTIWYAEPSMDLTYKVLDKLKTGK